MQITPAIIQDAEALLDLQKKAFHQEAVLHNNFQIPPLCQTIESLIQDFSDFRFFKAILDDRIVGSAKVKMLDSGRLSISRLVVHPDYQRRGIGKRMMLWLEEKYPDAEGFELFTAEKSISNLKFYSQLGYRITEKYTEAAHKDIVLVRLIKN